MKQRNDRLDLWRSLAVLTMLVFHALWDLEKFGVIPKGTMETPLADVVRYLGGGSFILISGLLVLRGHDPVRRGFALLCLGLAVAVVTTLIGLSVQFGILAFLGCCMLLCGALRKQLGRLRGWLPVLVFLLLFAGTWALTASVRVPLRFLFPLGLRAPDFYSADYWPLIPWGFLYLTGCALGAALPERFWTESRRIPAVLTFLGRHSLVIYLVHQPILYGVCWLFLRGNA